MKKNSIYLIIGAILICIGAIVFVNRDRLFPYNEKKESVSDNSEKLGEFKISQSKENLYEQGYDINTDGPIYAEDTEETAIKMNTVAYQNLDLVYDLLTLQALADITDETYNYLNMHGYSGSQKLSIIEDSIIYEKSYPYFEVEAEDMKDKILEVRYNLKDQKFEFAIRAK